MVTKKTLIISNWISLLSLAIYIGLVTTVDRIIHDSVNTNSFVNAIGNISMGVLYGLLFPIGWGLPLTLVYLLILITTDLLIIHPLRQRLISFAIQTLILLAIQTTLVFILELDSENYLFSPIFIVGQLYRVRRLKKSSS